MGFRTRLPLTLLGLSLVAAPPCFAQGAGDDQRLWWNDPAVVELLGLDAETRASMDAVERRYAVDGSAKRIRGSRAGLRKALIDRDWEDAELELQAIAEPTLKEGRLKIEVLKLLSAEQHAVLVARVPTVFRRKWKPARGWTIAPPPAEPAAKEDAAGASVEPDVEGLE